MADNHKLTLGLRYTEDQKSVNSRATFYDSPLVSAWASTNVDLDGDGANDDLNGDGAVDAADIPATFCTGAGAAQIVVDGNGDATGEITPASEECTSIGATVGQAIGSAPVVSLLGADGNANPLAADNASQYLLLGVDAFNADYTQYGVTPLMEFSNTTGRFVWDWQIDDDTLMLSLIHI